MRLERLIAWNYQHFLDFSPPKRDLVIRTNEMPLPKTCDCYALFFLVQLKGASRKGIALFLH